MCPASGTTASRVPAGHMSYADNPKAFSGELLAFVECH
jgi:hypothetical protein